MKTTMQKTTSTFRFKLLTAAFLLLGLPVTSSAASHYKQTNLVANRPGVAAHTDANLQNAWGIAFNPNGPAWVANNHSGTSTLYDGNGVPFAALPMIVVPGAGGSAGTPTGIVFNSSKDFNVTPGNPAIFIFANEEGSLAAWSPTVDVNKAKIVGGAVPFTHPIYKGLTMAGNGKAHFLYATDFHNAKVRVFDSSFKWVNAKKVLGCDFTDPTIPAGFAPFGIHNINGALFVTYAKQNAAKEDDVAGPGFGYVNMFDANGCLINRFASGGALNSPWAVALAPANFGTHSNQILVGNFGDGAINTYAFRVPQAGAQTGVSVGALLNSTGKKIKIDGLWDLAFGNGVAGQKTNHLFFSAGPNDETDGLYGKIEASK